MDTHRLHTGTKLIYRR